ncbi:MAG: hypothetical protein CMG04_08425 [Candidatus Marinimicrobia bacterium]|nr:hypothetical protein [Candidatus Neomarinimicrobiota bacterium]
MKNKICLLIIFIFLFSIANAVGSLRIAVIPETKEDMVTMLITGNGYKQDSNVFLLSLPSGSDSAFAIQTNQLDPIKFIPVEIFKENDILFLKVKKSEESFAYMINVFPEKIKEEFYFSYNMNFSNSINRLEFEIREPKEISNFKIVGFKQITKIEEADFYIHLGVKEKIFQQDTSKIIIRYSFNKDPEPLESKNENKFFIDSEEIIEPKNKVINRYKLYSWESLSSVLIIFLFSAFIIKYSNLRKKEEL